MAKRLLQYVKKSYIDQRLGLTNGLPDSKEKVWMD